MSVVLIGPPGSGKSITGKILAQKLSWQFLDADNILEDEFQASIPEVFERQGEEFFRQAEKRLLESLVGAASTKPNQLVLSTGGGMPVPDHNWQLLCQIGEPVWLFADMTTLLSRLRGGIGRPLLAKDPEAKLQSLLEARSSAYGRARYRIDTAGKPASDVAVEIINLLNLDG